MKTPFPIPLSPSISAQWSDEFTAAAVVVASQASTGGIVVTTATLGAPSGRGGGITDKEVSTYLDQRRKQIAVALPSVKPSGQRKVVITTLFTIALADLFDSTPGKKYGSTTVYLCGQELSLWNVPHAGLDVLQLRLQPEFCGSAAPAFYTH